MTFEQAYNLLAEYGQTHVLKYFDELNNDEKKSLLEQIENTDFSVLDSLNETEGVLKRGSFAPIGAVTKEEIAIRKDEFTAVGIDTLKAGKVAAVLLAGGQGTRLGFDKPKGMFNIGVNKELYIFECLINNLMDVVKQAGVWVPLYIMTSEKNNDDTINFLTEKNFFGYNPDYVKFFVQDMAASVDFNGKLLMESKSRISISPKGNGGWFSSIVKTGIINELKQNGVEWLNIFSVDNVLQRIADPAFIGAVELSGSESGSKVVSKAAPDEKVGVLCLEDGKPSIVEYYEMTDEMRNSREADGSLSYRFGVILNYLFKVSKLEEIVKQKMAVHIVKKKIPHIGENGELVTPDEPNGYKFELLVLDMICMHESCLSYEVERNREFAPVKNKTGVDSVDTARALLTENGVDY